MDKSDEEDAQMMRLVKIITDAIPLGTPLHIVTDAICMSVVLVAQSIARDTHRHQGDVLDDMFDLIEAIHDEMPPVDSVDLDTEEK